MRRLFAQICTTLVVLVSLAPAAQAQTGTVVGRVIDDEGRPIPQVNVLITSTSLGSATRLDGTYRIDGVPPGALTVVASAIGYQRESRTVDVATGDVAVADFTLSEIAIQSGEVVVTASRRERLTGGIAASVSTVASREIASRHSVDLDDALRHVSGVQMAGNQINIRGSSGFSFNTGSRVLLLIDGSPMLRPDVNGIPYEAIPMSQVRRIEVLKGPGSALYGGGALGGVINVITKDYPESPATSVTAFGGAYQPVRYGAWRRQWEDGDVPQPLVGFSAGYGRPLGQRSGIWGHVEYRYDAGHLRLDRRKKLQLYSKFTTRPFRNARLTILGGLTRRTSDNFLFWNGLDDPLNPGRIDFGRPDGGSGSDDNLINEFSLLPVYVGVVSPKVYVTFRGRLFGVLVQPLDEDGNPKPIAQGTTGLRYGGEVQTDFVPNPSRTITVGAAVDANAARSSYFGDREALRQPEAGAYVQWEESSVPRLTLAAGGRFDVYRVRSDLVTSKASPKLSASYAVTDRWILRGAFGEGFRVPSVMERFVSNADYLPLVSNLDLRPESSRSYEVGIRGYPPLRGLSIILDGAAFWSDYWQLIEPTFVPAERAFQFINLTRARIRGGEITATLTGESEDASLQLGYTFLDAKDLSVDRPLVFRSSHLLKLAGSVVFRGIRFGADYRFANKPDRVDSDFAMFVKDAQEIVPIHVLDLRVGRAFWGIETTIHLKNALDYYYVERPAILAPPRHVILKLGTRF